jgi:hypothetical protein
MADGTVGLVCVLALTAQLTVVRAGRVPPRGLGAGVGTSRSLLGLAGWAVALAAATIVAVVRSHRLTVPSTD